MSEISIMKTRLTSKEKHRKRREERRQAYISAAKKWEAQAISAPASSGLSHWCCIVHAFLLKQPSRQIL